MLDTSGMLWQGVGMESFNVLCYLSGNSAFAPLVTLTIRAGNEASARFQAYQQGAQEIFSVHKI